MGVNNKQRRAAKQRRRARQRSSGGPGPGSTGFGFPAGPGVDSEVAYGLAELQIDATVRRLTKHNYDDAELLQQAESLLRRVAPIPQHVVALVLRDLLARLADGVVRGGWGPADLEELVRRHDARLITTLAVVLRDETVPIITTDDLAAGLRLAALFAVAPLLEVEDAAKGTRLNGARLNGAGLNGAGLNGAGQEHPKLAQVRALLAKAESTDFEEEAEALVAKAQQLITRYSLARLVDETSAGGGDSGARPTVRPTVRRLWLDAPYVRAKAALVDEVAGANRCRTALAERLGFSLVVGAAVDLDAVELLVTSLLVQANTAMLRYGRSQDGRGASRTRSFRQSFLLAYAARVGQRLRAVTEAVATDGTPGMLPVLRDHETRVSEAFDAMVPHTVGRATSINDGEGWIAGLAAAELALLDVNGKLTGT